MAVLTIQWETLSSLPALESTEKVITGEASPAEPIDAEVVEPAKTSHDKPFVVYVADPAGAAGFDTVEKVILEDDRVKIASHAFHMVKMTPDDAKADALLKDKGGKEVPRIILVTADLKTVKPLEKGTLKLGELWGGMKLVANKHYKQDLDGMVRAMKDVLTDYDVIAKARSVLEDKEARAKDKPLSAEEQKKLVADKAELDKKQAVAEKKHKELFDLKLKGDKSAKKAA